VYVEHNAENLQFFLWYRDYVRRFEALPEKERVLSPEWIPESKETPNLSKDPEKEARKKGKRETIATLMDTGYDTKGSTFFGEDLEIPTSPTGLSVIKDNGSTVAPSVTSSTTATKIDLASQTGMKWQPCKLLSFFVNLMFLTDASHDSTNEGRNQSCHAPLSCFRCSTGVESLPQGPSSVPPCSSTHYSSFSSYTSSQYRRSSSSRPISSELCPLVYLQRQQAQGFLRPYHGRQ